jgi:AcrR family transcriptional regulator
MTTSKEKNLTDSPYPSRTSPDERLEAVASAALLIADRLGLRKLTIRRVAEEVGVAPMTIYGSVRSKEELVGLVARKALDELELPSPAARWEDGVVAIMDAFRSLMLTHPSLAQVFSIQRVSVGSVGLAALIDALLGELDRGGIDERLIVNSVSNLIRFALGFVVFELPRKDGNQIRATPGIASLHEVVALAEARSLHHLDRYASELMADDRADSYEEGVRSLVAGLPRRVPGSTERGSVRTHDQ